jgi:hypothetical protein
MWSIVTSRIVKPALASIRPATLTRGTEVSEAIEMLRAWHDVCTVGEACVH